MRKINLTSPLSPKANRPGKRRITSMGRRIPASTASTATKTPSPNPSHHHGWINDGTATATVASNSQTMDQASNREVGLIPWDL
ncbi:MAG: hypothetical protein ACRCXD_06660 [Luteolibacter sp.]